MQYPKMNPFFSVSFLAFSGLLLSACGSDSSSSSSVSTTLSGTAATGAPIALGSIVVHCQNSWNEGTTTDANGQWSLVVPTANLPCAVKASTPGASSQSFYSFTTGTGSSLVTNVTPLTSLALATTGFTPDDTWFNALNNAGLQALSGTIATAITDLQSALVAAGYNLPTGFNPFGVRFSAEVGNAYDDLLEDIKAALTNATTDLPALLASIAAGGELPAAPEDTEEPGDTCTSGDDKLVFTNGPADFCGFTKSASANTIENYFQFTSTSGTHGTTYVKFNLTENGSAVQSLMIENDDYAFSCGAGGQAACTGITMTTGNNYRQFAMANTTLEVVFGGTQSLVVNGLVIHFTSGGSGGTGGSDTITTPTLEAGEYGVRFASNGTIQSVAESGVVRFYPYAGNGSITTGSGDSAGLLEQVNLSLSSPFRSFGLRYLPNTPGIYNCGANLGSLNPLNIELAYAVGHGYSSIGTSAVSGFSCSVTITSVGSISGFNYTGATEGTFTARLFKTGAAVSLANSIVVSGSFRLGAATND